MSEEMKIVHEIIDVTFIYILWFLTILISSIDMYVESKK